MQPQEENKEQPAVEEEKRTPEERAKDFEESSMKVHN